MTTLLVRNGRVIDPASGRDGTMDVAVRDGKIVEIGAGLSVSDADRVIDAADRIVAPGLIDPHVHFREPGHEEKETIETGSLAAVAGGFTTVCCMPNTQPALDCPELIRFVYDRAAERAVCRVFPIGAVSKGRAGERLAEISLMHDAGAVGFSDDGDAVASAGLMARALAEVRETGAALMQHCQEPTLTHEAVMHAGVVSTRFGLTGWPRVAEEVIIERDIRLNRDIGCRYHVQHVSSAGSVEIIRRARADGQPVTAEVSPHHLLLTDEAVDRSGAPDAMAKVNPPLREQHDIDALRQGVADGTITVLATDHAPHTSEEKSRPIEDTPFGLIGLEAALALYVKALIEPGLVGWPKLIELMTTSPAALCGLEAKGLGRLTPGGPADLTIIEPEIEWTIGPESLAGKGRNTPFMGWTVKGRAETVVVAGTVRLDRRASTTAGTGAGTVALPVS
ncbi:MAG: dihydroorotase [Planctomycetes bacterium]|nr:dihydroorotase [Planctomycetota bacterium]